MNALRHVAAADAARDRYSSGQNCAQSVIGALADLPGVPALPDSWGAGYTTGIGGKGCVCGALAGGVAVLGEYAATGGLEPMAAKTLAEEMSHTLHTHFTDEFGSSCCRVIKRGQVEGSDEWVSSCANLTETTAAMVAAIIAEHEGAPGRARWAGRDALAAARRIGLDGLAGAGIALVAAALLPVGARQGVFAVVTLVLAVLAIVFELGAPVLRQAGRVLRATGAAAAAAFALAAAFAPHLAGGGVAAVFAEGPLSAILARAVVSLDVLAVAASAAFGIKRYR